MLICNGKIVNDNGSLFGDLRIEDGVITEIGALAPMAGEKVVDARGKLVMPGGVDVHTHMDMDTGQGRVSDDFYTGTAAAACGGTTTIVDHMGSGPKGCSIRHQLDVYHRLAEGKAVIDYSFHGVMDHVDGDILREISELAEEGITSHKFYLTYADKISDGEAFRLMERARELGVLLTVHPENDGVVNYLREKFRAEGKTEPIYHAESRPPECEAEAINRMILLARMAGDAPLYIVHLSCGLGLDYIKQARRHGQKRLYAETCPQYLLLDKSCYEKPDGEGLKYIMSPPLRERENNGMLWRGVEDGVIDTIATDHCPFFFSGAKQLGRDDFTMAPGGAPGVEARMALIFSEGVTKGRITAEDFVRIVSAAPAKLTGLYPRKGRLEPGSDGDIVIIDPEKQVRLTHSLLHENVDYTPYEGVELTGWPVMTISRGRIVAKDGVFMGAKGTGRFLKRGLPQLY